MASNLVTSKIIPREGAPQNQFSQLSLHPINSIEQRSQTNHSLYLNFHIDNIEELETNIGNQMWTD